MVTDSNGIIKSFGFLKGTLSGLREFLTTESPLKMIKIDQLIECDMGNIFLEKPYTKYGGETIRDTSKNSKLIISLDQ